MSDEAVIALYIFVPMALIGIGAAIVDWEHKRKKPNIRVPRETLWARTHRYHDTN